MTTSQTTSNPASSTGIDAHRLLLWFREHGRHDLPWRQTRNPYAILVSEVMLQQTQVVRVVPYWIAWMERWPDVERLSRAVRSEVIRAWAGLGYNNRAVRLHQLAQACTERHGGKIPLQRAELLELPGVGSYTADAVICFSGAGSTIPLDTNVARVMTRAVHGAARAAAVAGTKLRESAASVAGDGDAREIGTALMDLGATVCTAATPHCEGCPLAAGCRWRALSYPDGPARERTAKRFEETARWARGRIVARLREGAASEADLSNLLPGRHRPRTGDYLEALIADGLVERVNGCLYLSGDQAISMASPKL